MLKYRINKNKTKVKYEVIAARDFVQHDGDYFAFSTDYSSSFSKDNFISFYRKDGKNFNLLYEPLIADVEKIDSESLIKTDFFHDISLSIVSAYTETIDGVNYAFLIFNERHYADINKDGITVKVLEDGGYTSKICDGDYVIMQPYFLHQLSGGTFVRVNEACLLYVTDMYGNTLEISNALVPCTIEGQDMQNILMIPVDEQVQFIINNYTACSYRVKDQRFFFFEKNTEDNEEGWWNLILKPGAAVRAKRGYPEISIPIEQTFSPSLLSIDGLSQYLEETAYSKVEKALDYEKQQFIPVIKYGDSGYTPGTPIRVDAADMETVPSTPSIRPTPEPTPFEPVVSYSAAYNRVNKIYFAIHLRVRDANWNIIQDSGWTSINSLYGDLASSAGFSDEDIYYQRKCVSETFLRLSFYDGISRGSQKLLYTVKIALNANRLWTDYIHAVDNEVPKPIVDNFEGGMTDELALTFICSNKYDYDNSTEGFYLHLFPGNLKEKGEDGGIIYMKAEFCNAKYGKTIPLTVPVPPTVIEAFDISGETETFTGKTYSVVDESGNTLYTDMEQLNKDLYTRVKIMYHENSKVYMWYFPDMDENGNNMLVSLYEPKIV